MSGTQRTVCVVGSLNMDLVVRAPRFPKKGETILGGGFATFPGGKGANQAVAAARMGAKVSMIGRVGDDAYGEQLRAVLAGEGIDVGGVRVTPGTPTGVAVITVAEKGGNTIVVAPGANGVLRPDDIDASRDRIEAADAVLMQLETPLETVVHAARAAKAAGKLVMLNAAPALPLSPELLGSIGLLVVNQSEGEVVAADAAGGAIRTISRGPLHRMTRNPRPSVRLPEARKPVRKMLDGLASLGVPSVIVTFGEQGAACIDGGACTMLDAFAVNATDTVGAGDAFCGTLAAAWPCDGSGFESGLFREAVWDAASSRAITPAVQQKLDAVVEAQTARFVALRVATAAGALATMSPGAIPSLPALAQVAQFLGQNPL